MPLCFTGDKTKSVNRKTYKPLPLLSHVMLPILKGTQILVMTYYQFCKWPYFHIAKWSGITNRLSRYIPTEKGIQGNIRLTSLMAAYATSAVLRSLAYADMAAKHDHSTSSWNQRIYILYGRYLLFINATSAVLRSLAYADMAAKEDHSTSS